MFVGDPSRRHHCWTRLASLRMAFAIASGVPPQTGLVLRKSSQALQSQLWRVFDQIGGPTGAFVVVVFGIVANHGVERPLMCTLMAGVLLLIPGADRFRNSGQFIPRPRGLGFTNGIAVIHRQHSNQGFFGLKIAKVPWRVFIRMLTQQAGWRALNFSNVPSTFCFGREVARVQPRRR